MRMLVRIAGALLAVLACWQLAVWMLQPPRFILPGPGSVIASLVEQQHYLLSNAAITVLEIVLGLFFGAIAGILVALLVAGLPGFGQIVWPLLLVLQALPVFAIAPLLVLWFGFGLASKVVMASLIIFFPVASSFADGLRRTSQDL
ncbi:ABC transporter permease, partial [Escherichia coli]|nr:ABC transporter permease [Escherichia coli]